MKADRARTPAPPEAVREWMERFGGQPIESDAATLTEAALRALDEALRRPGRDREGAFALLAADGLLTYAVEAMSESDDPEAELDDLIRRIAVKAERGGG